MQVPSLKAAAMEVEAAAVEVDAAAVVLGAATMQVFPLEAEKVDAAGSSRQQWR